MATLARAADLLEAAVAAVSTAFASAPTTAYEADVEANLIIHLTIRDAEGVALLAREGAFMYPAAMVLTRAAYEGALRVMWMLHPDDPFEREARYLAMLKETEELARVAAREFAEMSAPMQPSRVTWRSRTEFAISGRALPRSFRAASTLSGRCRL